MGKPDHMGVEDEQVIEHPVENTGVDMPAGDLIPVEIQQWQMNVMGEYPQPDINGGSGGQYGLRRNWTRCYDHLKTHGAS